MKKTFSLLKYKRDDSRAVVLEAENQNLLRTKRLRYNNYQTDATLPQEEAQAGQRLRTDQNHS